MRTLLIPLTQIEKYRSVDLKSFFQRKPGISLRKIKIVDFFPINLRTTRINQYFYHGVYIFSKDKKPQYIGKNSNRTFVERIPAHFDIRAKSWFNTMLKYHIGKHRNKRPTENELLRAFKKIYATNTLLLIYVSARQSSRLAKKISRLESLLRAVLMPRLNTNYRITEKRRALMNLWTVNEIVTSNKVFR